jgi:hypothetical protein
VQIYCDAPLITAAEAQTLVRRARREGKRDGFQVLVTPRQVRAILQALGEWEDVKDMKLVRIWEWEPMSCSNIAVSNH